MTIKDIKSIKAHTDVLLAAISATQKLIESYSENVEDIYNEEVYMFASIAARKYRTCLMNELDKALEELKEYTAHMN